MRTMSSEANSAEAEIFIATDSEWLDIIKSMISIIHMNSFHIGKSK